MSAVRSESTKLEARFQNFTGKQDGTSFRIWGHYIVHEFDLIIQNIMEFIQIAKTNGIKF
jgi:hypothetical protein